MNMTSNSKIEEAMKRINLLEYIQHATNTKAKERTTSYLLDPCPFCKRKGHFHIRKNENYYNTFSGCGRSGTIIDFLMEHEHLSKQEAIQKTLALAGMESPSKSSLDTIEAISKVNKPQILSPKESEDSTQQPEIDFTSIIEGAHAQVEQTSYYKERGLTDKTIQRYKLGYDENGLNIVPNIHQNTVNPNFLAMYKYFLPTWDADEKCTYFIPRLDEASVPDYFKKTPSKAFNLPSIPVRIFNDRYLETDKNNVIFITEGIFDALSVEEFAYPAIALNGGNSNKLLELVEENFHYCRGKTFILIPDNDAAGEHLASKLNEGFGELGISCRITNLPIEYKDVNDFLKAGREGLKHMLQLTVKEVDESNEMKDKKQRFVSDYLEQFLVEVTERGMQPISTGFPELDTELSGGLFPGLYVLGAISSLGKTTFFHQMADFIAEQQIPVLFFSLEMSERELVSKSISRQTFLSNAKEAKSMVDILKGNVEREMLVEAIEAYKASARYVKIIEGSTDTDVLSIRKKIEEFKKDYDRFVVFVDYLQVMQSPKRFSFSDKQIVDYNVKQLKLISRDFDVPVLTVSSFNRSNYNQTVAMESFKESGGIEYSADVIMALEYKDMDRIAQEKNDTKRREQINILKNQPQRALNLVILKQRNGKPYAKVGFSYRTNYNYFRSVRIA